jgi:hypothetical protein
VGYELGRMFNGRSILKVIITIPYLPGRPEKNPNKVHSEETTPASPEYEGGIIITGRSGLEEFSVWCGFRL